jgi:ABC-type multidrug transport system ATPase subunit
MPPFIAASDLRVDVAGSPAIDGLTFASSGERVLVLGAARALFEAAAGLRGIAHGELAVEGAAPLAAVRSGALACAPLDPPMPPAWTLRQYAAWSARVAGSPRGAARAMADEALERMQLTALAATKIGAASSATRRGTAVAAALATGAPALLLDDPLSGLPDDAARGFARALARALGDRRAVVFAARVPLESPLALAADEAIVIDGPRVVAQGAPAEVAAAERTLALRVHGDVDAFARAVEAAGARALVSPAFPPPAYVRVELGPIAARDVLRIAVESQVVVVELRPLARAFA